MSLVASVMQIQLRLTCFEDKRVCYICGRVLRDVATLDCIVLFFVWGTIFCQTYIVHVLSLSLSVSLVYGAKDLSVAVLFVV